MPLTKSAGFAALALVAALGLAACSEGAEERTPQEAAEAAEPQNTEFTGDIGAATQEAVSDTNAAASEAAAAGTTSAPAASDAAPAAPATEQ